MKHMANFAPQDILLQILTLKMDIKLTLIS